jgi:hypothetical protein
LWLVVVAVTEAQLEAMAVRAEEKFHSPVLPPRARAVQEELNCRVAQVAQVTNQRLMVKMGS